MNFSAEIILYTDGACKGNPGKGGYGGILEWVGHAKSKEFSQGYQLTTNNRMELLAVIVGLESLKKPNLKVLVVSDSKYVVDAVEKKWVFTWEKKYFSGKKNADLWRRFLKVYRLHQVRFQWVKGHNNHPQNERCDFLAVQASEKANLKEDTFYVSSEIKGETFNF